MTAGIAEMLPGLRETPGRQAWSAVRQIFDPGRTAAGGTARVLSRSFSVLDHGSRDGVEGLLGVVGGKLPTCRLMAEKAADLACLALGTRAPCLTAETPL